MPDLLKIGFTQRSIEQRLDELDSATGVAWPFELEFCIRVRNANNLERRLHQELREFRVRPDREFFRLSQDEAIKRILSFLTPAELAMPDQNEEVASIQENLREITDARRRRVRRTNEDNITSTSESLKRVNGERSHRSNNGRNLNEQWRIGARHALYRKTGDWYMPLKKFPGALCDENGFILFLTETEYRSCPFLRIGVEIDVPNGGISKIPGYKRMKN